MDTAAVSAGVTTAASSSASSRGAGALTSDDFFKLLVAQLSHQDPLEPTSNEQLLQQISSIREIDLSSTLVSSLRSLTDQQRFGSAAGLIGTYVTAQPDPQDPNSTPVGGMVTGLRFDGEQGLLLQLSSGQSVALDQVANVMDPTEAAEAMIGKLVSGIGFDAQGSTLPLSGIVTSASKDTTGEIVLNLDTGQTLKLSEVVTLQEADELVASA